MKGDVINMIIKRKSVIAVASVAFVSVAAYGVYTLSSEYNRLNVEQQSEEAQSVDSTGKPTQPQETAGSVGSAKVLKADDSAAKVINQVFTEDKDEVSEAYLESLDALINEQGVDAVKEQVEQQVEKKGYGGIKYSYLGIQALPMA